MLKKNFHSSNSANRRMKNAIQACEELLEWEEDKLDSGKRLYIETIIQQNEAQSKKLC
jgi:hypothetical protein